MGGICTSEAKIKNKLGSSSSRPEPIVGDNPYLPFTTATAVPAPAGSVRTFPELGITIQNDQWEVAPPTVTVAHTKKTSVLTNNKVYSRSAADALPQNATDFDITDCHCDSETDPERTVRKQRDFLRDRIKAKASPGTIVRTVKEEALPSNATRGPFTFYLEMAVHEGGSQKPTLSLIVYDALVEGKLLMTLRTTVVGEPTNEIRSETARLANSIQFLAVAQLVPKLPSQSMPLGPFNGFGFCTFPLRNGKGTMSVPPRWTFATNDEVIAGQKADASTTLAVLYAPRTRKALIVGDPRDEAAAAEEPAPKIANVAGTGVSLTRYKGGARYLQHPSLPVSLRSDADAHDIDETTLAQIVASISLNQATSAQEQKTIVTAPFLGLAITLPESGVFSFEESYFITPQRPSVLIGIDETTASTASKSVRLYAVDPSVNGDDEQQLRSQFSNFFRNVVASNAIKREIAEGLSCVEYSNNHSKMVAVSFAGRVVGIHVECKKSGADKTAEQVLSEVVKWITVLV